MPHNNIIGKNQESNLSFIKKSNIWRRSYKFTVVRNPISRFLSSVNFLLLKKYVELNGNVIDFILDVMFDGCQNYHFYYDPKHEIKKPDAKSCIKRITLPMTHDHYCLMSNDKLDINYFIKIEDLQNNMDEFYEKIKINKTKIPHLNKSDRIIGLKDLSNNHMEKIKKYYELDCKVFDYHF